jgi:pimeloyl-ACP methyl ester carboxylesterase
MNRPQLCAIAALTLVVVDQTKAHAQAHDQQAKCLQTAPGECLQVTISGAGVGGDREVVLIPGLFGSAFAFRRVIPLLTAQGFRTIVVEPLGVGSSARPAKADYTLTAQSDRIQKALDLLGVRNPVLVSHSIGTSIALRLATRHPGTVRAVVSLEGGAAESVATKGFRRAMMLAPLLKLFGGARLVRGKVHGMLVERSANPAWVTNEIVDGYTEGAARDMDATLEALSQMSKTREPEALLPRLASLRFPVRLVLGAFPHAGGPSDTEVQMLEKTLSAFSVTRVPGSGHFIFEESPEAVVRAVDEVIRVPRDVRRVEN